MDGASGQDIKISELLEDKYIELDLKERAKKEVICKLAEVIAKSGRIKNKNVILKAVMAREKLGSTGIGNGVAIPHAKLKSIKKPLLVFGRSVEGVDFDSLDGEKTYLFFMLISPQEEVGIHLKLLARISHVIRDKFTVGRLRKIKIKEDVYSIISDVERYFK